MVNSAKNALVAGMLVALAACSGQAGEQADQADLTPGEPHPEYGMASTITEAMTANAAGLVTEGKVYPLGVVTGPDSVPYPGRSFSIETFAAGDAMGANRITGHDDRLVTHVGIGSQIDGLGHIGRDGVHYGGVRAEEFLTPNGLTKFGTDQIPPIATRGVLIDMAKHFGTDRLEPMASFGGEDIAAAAEAQGVEIRAGDVVLLHSGWLSMAEEDPEAFIARQPGINADGAEYLAGLGVVAVGADSAALETMSFEDGIVFPVHAALLVDHGIYILETMNTGPLAADEIYEFFFVLGQPRFAGSVQAVINPLAIK
ncbi:probable polyketide cyclase [Erythrobacter sp. NAP1]|uniref:cyclase family protein n=1 Tax=Erythrobacter sp. NAP1 TaxID=237727 RepID=UPI0000686C24|nr:probable polyketide cyclase [Erythrobacter sp. NAP1]